MEAVTLGDKGLERGEDRIMFDTTDADGKL